MAMVQGKRVVVPEAAWRSTVRRLGWFTVGELASELGCSKGTAKRRLDILAALDPPLVAPAGRLGRDPMFKYIKPDDAGERFHRQQERRFSHAAPEDEVIVDTDVDRTGMASRSLLDSIRDKEVRKACQWAIGQGWRLEQSGGEHPFRLVRSGKRSVAVPSSPRSSQAAATMVRQKCMEHSRHQRLRQTG